MDIVKLKEELPNISIRELNAGTGANIHLPGKLIITVWFNRKLFKTNESKKFRKFSDDKDIVNIICAFGNLKSNIDTPAQHYQIQQNNGTIKCIDHIKRKLKTVREMDPTNTKGIFMLLLLEKELEQYL